MLQLQGAGAADAGGDHGDAHLLWPGLRRGEGRARHHVHIHAPGRGGNKLQLFSPDQITTQLKVNMTKKS